MTITVYKIQGSADGLEAEISLEIVSGEHTQTIKGKVSVSQLMELGFASKMHQIFEIDRVTCDAVLRSMKLYAAVKNGMALLGYARNTKRTLKQKLVRKGYPADIAEEAADYLAAHGYIREGDDAELFAETLATRRLYGMNRIKKELYAKGFEAEVIRDTLDSMEVDFDEICAKRIEKMGGKSLFEEKNTKQKTMAALLRYGFSYENIRGALALLSE